MKNLMLMVKASLFRRTRESAYILKDWLDTLFKAGKTKYKNVINLPLNVHGIENIDSKTAEAIVYDNNKKQWHITIKRLN